jgi:hypothetical protein
MLNRHERRNLGRGQLQGSAKPRVVESLLDAMKDGREYESIVGLNYAGTDLTPELKRSLAAIEQVRQRPCIAYVANVVRPGGETSITAADHLPFQEMVSNVPLAARKVDVMIATPGGSAETVTQFVDALRRRFDEVDFLIPYMAMSAGTLWALSGDRIWMDERAFIGPIDPQVPAKDGRFVPAQALLALLARIQTEGQAALARGAQPNWTHVVLLKELDARVLGAALTASDYSINMAADFLAKYKFKSWTTHSSSGQPVTGAERTARAKAAAAQLCDHERWKAHGHGIARDVLQKELRILPEMPESQPGLLAAMRRAWALFCYVFERTPTSKALVSQHYSFVRHDPAQVQLLARGA